MEFKHKQEFQMARALCILNTISLFAIGLILLLPPRADKPIGLFCLSFGIISLLTNFILANFSKLYVENSNEEKTID